MSRSALALCLLAAVCVDAHPSRLRGLTPDDGDRVVGGEPVDIWQFPWQVSLEEYIQRKFWHFCGGSIISSTWVMTAAHCIRDRTAREVYVRAGSSCREAGGFLYPVANIIQHEDYNNRTKDSDIALLEISERIAFGSVVQAVILGSSEIVGGTKVNVSGWGQTSIKVFKPLQLHAITTAIVHRDACSRMFKRRGGITERMICAGGMAGSKGVCMADSGGALVAGNTQYGVVSWGLGCALPRIPEVYSYVPAFRSWITEKTGV